MYEKIFKRVFDFLGAFILIILLSPLMILIFVLVRLRLGKPAIFRQERPGLNEKIFQIYKFRSMSFERDENGEFLSDEKRLNGFGKMLRNTSLDELPQLFNIIKGDMSFIGPRPLLKEYLPLYSKEQSLRHQVRPGLTGLAQIKGRNALSWRKKLKFDAFYAKNLSLKMDLKIAVLTIKTVLKKRGVSKPGMATTIKFNGKN